MRIKRLVWVSVVSIFGMVLIALWFHETTDLSGQNSATVKNGEGQPAELWWWRPRKPPAVVIYPKDFADPGAKDFADEYGEILGNFGTFWLTHRWHKVAKISVRKNGLVKVYLVDPPSPEHDQHREYIANPSELTRNRSIW